jgi:hypothetical protein
MAHCKRWVVGSLHWGWPFNSANIVWVITIKCTGHTIAMAAAVPAPIARPTLSQHPWELFKNYLFLIHHMGSETRHRKHAGPANRQGKTQFTTKTEVPYP